MTGSPHRQDITRTLEGLHLAGLAVARAGRLEEVLEAALDGLQSALGVARSAVLLFDPAGTMRFVAWRGLSDPYRSAVEGHNPWGSDDTDPQPVVLADVATDASLGSLRAVVQGEGIAALTFVPLVLQGRLLGKLMLYYAAPHDPDAAELLAARLLATQIAYAIARFQAEAALRRSRDELAVVLEGVADGITAQGPDGRLRYANDAAARLLDCADAAELLAIPAEELARRYQMLDEAGQPVPWERLPGRLALAGRPSELVLCYRDRERGDRVDHWSHVRAQPVRDEAGQVVLAVNVSRDITRQRRAEAVDRFLLEASRLLASALDLQDTLERLVQLAVPDIADLCDVRLLDHGELPVALAHADPQMLPLVRELLATWPLPDDSPSRRAMRTGQPQLSADIPPDAVQQAARDPRHLEVLTALALRSTLQVPLQVQGRTLGVLGLANSSSRRRLDETDVDLAVRLADRVAVAIENARLFRSEQQARERLAVTLRSIGDAVISTDTQGRVVLLNGVAEQLTGWKQAEALGQPLADVFRVLHERTGKPAHDAVAEVLQTGHCAQGAHARGTQRIVVEARDGTLTPIADSAAPIVDRDGRTLGVVLVFRDVSQMQRLENERARTSKLESLGVLAGGIAHDFNNILTGILGNLSFATSSLPTDATVLPVLQAAEQACDRARDLTRQLLTFARGGAPVKAVVELGPLLAEVSGFALQGSSARAELRLAPDLWPVEADASQVHQVVHNLLLNARQAMPDGGVIQVAAENVTLGAAEGLPLEPGAYVRVTVTDPGVGIAAPDLARVFDPFFTTRAQGSGLGLATSHSIVQRHGGHITLDSVPGRGTRVTFYLPVAPGTAMQKASEVVPPPPRTPRVLVMDDDAQIRQLTTVCLKRLGYEVEVAADGAEAIARYRDEGRAGRPFAVVLMDLTVPGGMGGCEAIARLRELDPGVRAIVSSGYSNDPVLARHRDYGFLGVIHKPYRLADLGRALEDVLALPVALA